MSANAPYGTTYTSPAPPLFANPFVTAATGQDLGQLFPLQLAPLNASAQHPDTTTDLSQFEPISGLPNYLPSNHIPYTEEYMLSIERGLGANTVLSLNYVGNQAHRLLVLEESNPGNPALCLFLSNPANLAAGQTPCGPFGEDTTYTTAAGQIQQGTRGPVGTEFRQQCQPGHHRKLQLQLAAGHLAAHGPEFECAGRLHLQQIAGSIFEFGRSSQSAESFAEQSAVFVSM